MEFIIAFCCIIVSLILVALFYKGYVRNYRTNMISTYRFPASLKSKLSKTYPHLSDDQLKQVIEGLREYFHIVNVAGKNRMVAMPSQAVDVAWHEFILFTKEYDRFCKKALGRFLHHTPAEAMKTPTKAQEGIKRAWRISCERANINPAVPTRLPLLFAIDANLDIEDGFTYYLNCKKPQAGSGFVPATGHCASHIGCSSGCGGNTGSGGSDGCSGGSGCSGGCGGS